MRSSIWSPADLTSQLPDPAGGLQRYLQSHSKGDAELGLHAPVKRDEQTPHDRDEFHFVIAGTGILAHDGRRSQFRPGDALFVAARIEHRFEVCSEDCAAWVVFAGPGRPL